MYSGHSEVEVAIETVLIKFARGERSHGEHGRSRSSTSLISDPKNHSTAIDSPSGPARSARRSDFHSQGELRSLPPSEHVSDVEVFHLVEAVTAPLVVSIFTCFGHVWPVTALRNKSDSESFLLIRWQDAVLYTLSDRAHRLSSELVQPG